MSRGHLHELADALDEASERLAARGSIDAAIVLDAIGGLARSVDAELVALEARAWDHAAGRKRADDARDDDRQADDGDRAREDERDDRAGGEGGLSDRRVERVEPVVDDGAMSSAREHEHEAESGEVHAGDSANRVRMRCPYCEAVVVHGQPETLLELARSMSHGVRCGACSADVTTDVLDFLGEAVAR